MLQGVHSNYDTDLFQGLIDAAADITQCTDRDNDSLKVIADHIRACAFLIADGVVPSREGRGYVLRRIIRRAVRHGHKLGCKEPFFNRMLEPLRQQMGEAYPQLVEKNELIHQTLLDEEQRFARTLDTGMKILGDVIRNSDGSIDGKTAFLLYDTYGFPLDLTQDIAREKQLTVDTAGFDEEMEKQKGRARAAGKFDAQAQIPPEAIQALARQQNFWGMTPRKLRT